MKFKRSALIGLAGFVSLLGPGCHEQAGLAKEPLAVQIKVSEPTEDNLALHEPTSSCPRITFENAVLDFGEVGPNTDTAGCFRFTNTGQGPLKIMQVKRCCGIVIEWDKGKEYAPGESGVVSIRWRSGPQPNLFVRHPIIYSNDITNPAADLTVRAKTVRRISCEPEVLKLFVHEENAGCPKITLSSLDGRPFSISGFTSTSQGITADYDSSAKATKFVLEPKVDAEKLSENLTGIIDIATTHPEGNSIKVFFRVVPKYTCVPSPVMIFSAERGKPMVKTISVLNNRGGDFEIDSVSSKSKAVAIEVLSQKRIPNGYQLDVEMTPPDADNAVRFADEFSINIKGGEKLAIRCNGGFFSKK